MKKLCSILLLILLVFALGGCKGEAVKTGEAVQPATVEASADTSDLNMIAVTISIDAKTAYDKGYIDYEYILEGTKVEIEQGSSVWDVLNKVTRSKGIPVVKKGSGNHLYVSHINSIGEFDFKEKGSGWNYNVNGIYSNYGCDNSKSVLKDGDVIQWRFTLNLGKDLGASVS